MAERFVADYGLPEYDATTLTQSPAMAAYFEQAAQTSGQPKLASNWVMGEISRRLNLEGVTFPRVRVHPLELGALLKQVAAGETSSAQAKTAFDEMWRSVEWLPSGGRHISMLITDTAAVSDEAVIDVSALIEAKGLKQMNDSGALEKIIDEVIAANPANVEQFKAGKDKAFNALVGQVMKASQGKANPAQVNELLRSRLAG